MKVVTLGRFQVMLMPHQNKISLTISEQSEQEKSDDQKKLYNYWNCNPAIFF